MQSMLGDETLSKELKSALVGKTSGARPVASSGDAAVEEEEGQTPASTQTVKEKKAI